MSVMMAVSMSVDGFLRPGHFSQWGHMSLWMFVDHFCVKHHRCISIRLRSFLLVLFFFHVFFFFFFSNSFSLSWQGISQLWIVAQASSRADDRTQLNRVYKRQITVRPFVLDENWPGFDVLCEENEVSFVRISPVKFMSSLFSVGHCWSRVS